MRCCIKNVPTWSCVLCLGVIALLGPGSAVAQLAAPTQAAEAAGGMGERYRDGARWMHVEREPPQPGALPWVRIRRADGAGTTFRAQVDARAIVQLAPGVDRQALFSRERLQLTRELSRAVRVYLVAADSGEDGARIASRLARTAGVVSAIPDLHVQRVRHGISIPPNDARYGAQWYLKKLSIERAWRHSTGDPETIAVVIDDGCDMQHPDLEANLLGGTDLVDGDDNPSYAPGKKGNAHGTACAGLIAAQADNEIGIAGVCPECSLRCVRLLPADDKGVPLSRDIAAFDYAFNIGAAVVSNSWGFGGAMPVPAPLRSLLEKLFTEGRGGKGTLVLFSAGNEDRELEPDEIDGVKGVLSIGAINNFDEAAPFSNRGPSLDLTAPAGTFTTDISGADGDDKGDYTSLFGGTSSACPLAAGVAALVMSARKDMTAAEVSDLLQQTARKAPFARPDSKGHDPTYGYGIVDPLSALRSALDITEPEPEPEPEPEKDAGARAPDAGMKAPSKDDDSGCRVGGAEQDASSAVALLGLCAWLGLRRRSARRR